MAVKPTSLGALIDGIWEQREKKRALEAQVKTIEDIIAAQEEALMARMDKETVDKSTGKRASASITETIVANIKDFDELCKYVKKTGYFHLFQRRVSDVACRELFEKNGKIPGLESFTKRKVNIRTLSS